MKDDARAFWHAKARTFPRYENKENNYEAKMLGIIRKSGVDFAGKRVLDIGCGSGMYTIRIAQLAQSVLAIDIAEEMLRILDEDARTHGLTNITGVCSTWEDFETDERFDIVFASMTPAISTDSDREKMLGFGAGWGVFMGFSDRMASDVMAGLYEHYGITPREFNSAQEMRAWLEAKGVAYRATPVHGEWVVPWTSESLLDACSTTLERYGAEPDMALLRQHIESFKNSSGEYVERTLYNIEVITWQHFS